MKNENICTRYSYDKFRKRIEELREKTSQSQKEFAKGIGVNVRTYQNWINPLYKNYKNELQYSVPKIDDAIRICDKYNVSLDWLFGGIECETVTNQEIKDMIGIDDEGIKGLKEIKLSDDNARFNEQPGLCVLPIFNKMLGQGISTERLFWAFRDFFYTDYCVPVYHTDKWATKDSKRLKGKILVAETISSNSDLDVIKGQTVKYKEKGKEKTATFPNVYIQHFAKENDLYDNKAIAISKEFLQAVALKEIEQAALDIKRDIENPPSGGQKRTIPDK